MIAKFKTFYMSFINFVFVYGFEGRRTSTKIQNLTVAFYHKLILNA